MFLLKIIRLSGSLGRESLVRKYCSPETDPLQLLELMPLNTKSVISLSGISGKTKFFTSSISTPKFGDINEQLQKIIDRDLRAWGLEHELQIRDLGIDRSLQYGIQSEYLPRHVKQETLLAALNLLAGCKFKKVGHIANEWLEWLYNGHGNLTFPFFLLWSWGG